MHGATLIGEDGGVVELGLDFHSVVGVLGLLVSVRVLKKGSCSSGIFLLVRSAKNRVRLGGRSDVRQTRLPLFLNKKKLALPCEAASGFVLRVVAFQYRLDAV